MEQNDAAIFFFPLFLISRDSSKRHPSTRRRSHHGRDFDQKPIPAQMALQISAAGLRFRQKGDMSLGANQLRGQLQFSQCRFFHAGIRMGKAMQEPSEPKMARLIGTVPVKLGPTIF
jgi:hypothetical protein